MAFRVKEDRPKAQWMTNNYKKLQANSNEFLGKSGLKNEQKSIKHEEHNNHKLTRKSQPNTAEHNIMAQRKHTAIKPTR